MTVQETVQQLQYTPLTYRLQVIELLLQSLKEEIAERESAQALRKPFRMQTFDLGIDVTVDRKKLCNATKASYAPNFFVKKAMSFRLSCLI